GEKGHYTVEADGPRMRVYHGPDLILQAEDASYLTGTVGFVADWDPYGRWDDVRVTPQDSRGDACDPCPGIVDPACVPACDDTDGDGYGTTVGSCGKQQADCASTDPSIYPGVAEVCDGLDNDCDGRSDEKCTRVPTAYSYNAFNQIQTAIDPEGVTGFEYDRNGNQTRRMAPDGATTEYVWDLDNRLTQARLPSGVVGMMAYGTDGLRTMLEDAEGAHVVLLDGVEEIAEYDAVGANRSVWIRSPTTIDEVLSTDGLSGSGFFELDAMRSVGGMAGEGGIQVSQVRYDVFGQPAFGVEAQGGWGYSGRRHDSDGLIYYRARYYNPRVSVFLSADPALGPGGPAARTSVDDPLLLRQIVNPYVYVLQSPTNYSDPSGLLLGFSHMDMYTLLETGVLWPLTEYFMERVRPHLRWETCAACHVAYFDALPALRELMRYRLPQQITGLNPNGVYHPSDSGHRHAIEGRLGQLVSCGGTMFVSCQVVTLSIVGLWLLAIGGMSFWKRYDGTRRLN
ncbi:MAG: RHS repeat-associated core domain-containing protein, partial [Pseudomonadota bacterium]